MWVLGGIVFVVAALAVPVLIVVFVVRAGRHGVATGTAPGAPVRRFFHYGLMFVALVLTAIGLDGLIRSAFEAEGMITRGSARVAGSLALVVIAGPVFFGLALWTRRQMAADPGERLSIGWLLYITGVTVISLAVAMTAASGSIGYALGSPAATSGLWAMALVWGVVWALHWVASSRLEPADGGRSHRLLGSLFGLWVLFGSVVAALALVMRSFYYQVMGQSLATTLAQDLRGLAGPLVVSAGVWWWYWHRTTRHQAPTAGWHAYVLLGGVLAGLLVVLASAGGVVFAVLGWFLIDPASSAVDHFSIVPEAAAVALVGWAVWAYHRRVFRAAVAGDAGEVSRAYTYLLTTVGLVAMVVGLTLLVTSLIQVITDGDSLFTVDAGELALWGLTLGAVGVPLWWSAWSSVHAAGRDEVAERTSLSRRLYLSASFGIGGVVALVSLLVAASRVLEDVFEGRLGMETLFAVRWSLALVIAVGAVAAYHWRVFQADRAAAPERSKSFERLLLVTPGDSAALGRALAERTGARVEVWSSGEGEVAIEALTAAAATISGPEGVLVVGADGTVMAVTAHRIG